MSTSDRTIENELKKSEEQIKEIEGKIKEEESIIEKLQRKVQELRKKLSRMANERDNYYERLIIKRGIPSGDVVRRNKILEMQGRVASKKITIEQKEQLEKDLALAISELQSHCKHPFVFSYDGYTGSYSYDFDDKRNGTRICVICSLEDTEVNAGRGEYKVLAPADQRLIKRDIRKRDLRALPRCEWLSLREYLQVFRMSVGSINLEWPDAKTLQKTA